MSSNIILWYTKENKLQIVNDSDVFSHLYYSIASIPSERDLREYVENNPLGKLTSIIKGSDDQKIKEIKTKEIKTKEIKDNSDTYESFIISQKKKISKINCNLPLYDEYTKNMFLISRDNIYTRVMYQHYRFPDNYLIKYLKKELSKIKKLLSIIPKDDIILLERIGTTKFIEITRTKYQKYVLVLRKYRKLYLMISFMENFDIDILQQNYQTTFYNYSNKVGKNITICIRPSFKPHFAHINPYYTRSELINLGLNMEIIKPSNIYYTPGKILKLCEKVKKNDIDSETISNHQMHIIRSDRIGLIQYYSLQGSYFINRYLRGMIGNPYKNPLLDKITASMYDTVNDSPKFDKNYILYRFIDNDSHLKYLKVGDIYTTNSFVSTTRDPFYKSDIYKFGFVLVKIKIPKNVKGVALCIETLSHFPKEQEILLSPMTKLKLVKKNRNSPYYHTDQIFVSEINTRYEFEYVGKNKLSLPKKIEYTGYQKTIDFLKIPRVKSLTINERIVNFFDKYVNDMGFFKYKIGDKVFKINTEWYDSTSVYRQFYSKRIDNGFSIYLMYQNYIHFFIEIGEDTHRYMYVNYYFRISSTPKKKAISDDDFIYFISTLAWYFSIEKVIIYADYSSCELGKDSCITYSDSDTDGNVYYRGGNYCTDFYNYLNKGEKKYSNFDSTELTSMFYYSLLDVLKLSNPLTVLSPDDRDEIYQIYIKSYVIKFEKSKHNLADFYVWMIRNYCYCSKTLIKKFYKIYPENNPFDNDKYVLNPYLFLYNRNIIEEIITCDDSIYDSNKNKTRNMPKNDYRINKKR